jgi:methyl-accepting chemotaxis protein/hemerythrin
MLNWSEALSVGVRALDEDHKLLLVVADAVAKAVDERERHLAMAGADVLAETCRAHFRREDQLLDAGNFPELDEHRLGHTVFLEELDNMRFDIDRGLWLPAQARLGDLASLLKNRLLTDDHLYGDWLRRKGLVPVYDDFAFVGWDQQRKMVGA